MNLIGSIVPGFVELAALIAILVVVFGARRLPDLGEAIGRRIDRTRARGTSEDKPKT